MRPDFVNSDASIRRLKGPDRPIVPEQDRVKLLSELACVDYIVLFGDEEADDPAENDTPKPLLRAGDEAALAETLRALVLRKPERHDLNPDGRRDDDDPMAMSRLGG